MNSKPLKKKKEDEERGVRETELALAWFFEAASQYEEVVAVSSDHRYMRSGFAFLTEGMETRGIQLALTSKSVYSHSRSVSPLMADQSTSPGEKAAILWATRADVGCATPQNVGPCDGSEGRLETNCKIAAAHIVFVSVQ